MNRIIETTDIEKVKSDITFDISKGRCSVKEFKKVIDDLIVMLKNYEKDLTCFNCKLVEYDEDKLSNCDYCEKKFCSSCITIGENRDGDERKLCANDLNDTCAGKDCKRINDKDMDEYDWDTCGKCGDPFCGDCLDTNPGRRAYCHNCIEL
jgi:hypothetical protein